MEQRKKALISLNSISMSFKAVLLVLLHFHKSTKLIVKGTNYCILITTSSTFLILYMHNSPHRRRSIFVRHISFKKQLDNQCTFEMENLRDFYDSLVFNSLSPCSVSISCTPFTSKYFSQNFPVSNKSFQLTNFLVLCTGGSTLWHNRKHQYKYYFTSLFFIIFDSYGKTSVRIFQLFSKFSFANSLLISTHLSQMFHLTLMKAFFIFVL